MSNSAALYYNTTFRNQADGTSLDDAGIAHEYEDVVPRNAYESINVSNISTEPSVYTQVNIMNQQ